ncbi:MAG: glycoside hydrolase family 95 protein, partial [Bacteroidales bacterium]|nr:glycoside hydrolase family 95 protein [Bacteroidales bacterium]
PYSICRDILDNIGGEKFRSIEKRHITDHRNMFERVSLSLGADTLKKIPVDERLERVRKGGEDNGLAALYFAYGRYLLMGSSRPPAVLPANLQGIWNKDYNAPWNSDFHTNINLQMNYWPAEVCDLSETAEVLANFVSKLTVPGSVTAREMYGTDGWTMHHLTDPFGRTGLADGLWGLTPTNGPWMTFPLFEHYLFTLDTGYLRKVAYPVLKGSVQFLLGFLVESPEGYLVTNPSTSPENRYIDPKTGKTAWLTYSATIDVQTVNAVFDYFRKAAGILKKDENLVKLVIEAQRRLPPVRISSNGTIQEWISDFEEPEPGHRHISHLLGLYPLAQITPDNPDLYDAARKTIERRLSFGGGHTGWSRAWIINFYARLNDGNKAYEHLMLLFRRSTLKNLFDTHPPFQIDGNFGGTAGIAEMLMQSHREMIELLPALPDAWKAGKVKGLIARGGFKVDFAWDNGKLTEVKVFSSKGGTCRVKYGQRIVEKETQPGRVYILKELYSER